MSTGRKTLRENTRERVISSDFNRAQTFGQADANDILAAQVVQPMDDTAYIGATFPNGTTPPGSAAIFQDKVTAPAYGAVLEGLMVIVPAAGVSLIITPGLALIVDPDGQPGSTNPLPPNPDDSVTKLVRGLGVPLGALPWTPNGAGGIRVDVVEIQRVDVVTETDNRDIFNPSTGLFTAQSVVKVTDGQVSYRIRLGTPGGGLPPPALGWLPLAVLATPVGAVDLDAVEVWDVRNLATDYPAPGAARLGLTIQTEQAEAVLIDSSVAATLRLSGVCVRSVAGLRFGGALADIATSGSIDLLLAKYQEAGFAAVASLPYYVYCAYPDGYGRWVRYYKTAIPTVGGRVPGFLRGFPLLSQIPPLNGIASAPIAMPAFWGIGGAATFSIVLASSVTDTTAALHGSLNDGDMTHADYINAGTGLRWQTLFGTIVGLNVEWPLVPGANYPNGARRIRVNLDIKFPAIGAAGSSFLLVYKVGVYNTITNLWMVQQDVAAQTIIAAGAGNPEWALNIDIPVGGPVIFANPPVLRLEVATFSGSVAAPVAITTANAVVMAWDDR
jgi:hypothetical protein